MYEKPESSKPSIPLPITIKISEVALLLAWSPVSWGSSLNGQGVELLLALMISHYFQGPEAIPKGIPARARSKSWDAPNAFHGEVQTRAYICYSAMHGKHVLNTALALFRHTDEENSARGK